MQWAFLHPEAAGFIPQFLSEADPRPAARQFDEAYAHGGGWRPMEGWERDGVAIRYPGDPALRPIAAVWLRHELIAVYPHAWVAIFQPDGRFEVARMD